MNAAIKDGVTEIKAAYEERLDYHLKTEAIKYFRDVIHHPEESSSLSLQKSFAKAKEYFSPSLAVLKTILMTKTLGEFCRELGSVPIAYASGVRSILDKGRAELTSQPDRQHTLDKALLQLVYFENKCGKTLKFSKYYFDDEKIVDVWKAAKESVDELQGLVDVGKNYGAESDEYTCWSMLMTIQQKADIKEFIRIAQKKVQTLTKGKPAPECEMSTLTRILTSHTRGVFVAEIVGKVRALYELASLVGASPVVDDQSRASDMNVI